MPSICFNKKRIKLKSFKTNIQRDNNYVNYFVQVSEIHRTGLVLAPRRQVEPLDLGDLILETRGLPDYTTITCQSPGWCGGQALLARVVPMPGDVLVIKVERVGHIRPLYQKVVTPLIEPVNDHDEWLGKHVATVLSHQETTDSEGITRGHWVSHRKVNGDWWRLDSAMDHLVQQNPFNILSDGFTIDILMLK
jgi:hypothetical protein